MLIDEMIRQRELGACAPRHFEVQATDISRSALRIATDGRYDRIAMSRGMTDPYRERFFRRTGDAWLLHSDVRSRVDFGRHNLQDDFGHFGRFDLVLLRNVTMYLAKAFKENLFERVGRALAPGGVLLLGASESLVGQTPRSLFESRHGHGAMYFVPK